jgi:phosphate-selective porin OprO/OprP
MGDGTELRRARIYIKGKMYNDWLYKLQYDFASDSMIDAYLGYTGFEDTEILVGHFRDHTFLGDETSDTNIQHMERSLVNLAFDQGRHIGVGATHYGSNWLVSGGLFGDKLSAKGNTNDEGWGVAGRAVFNPILENERVVHLGVFADKRMMRSSGTTVSFSASPESHLGGLKLVNTGNITMVDDYVVSGLESAISLGSWNAQAEYGQTEVSVDGGSDLDFDGWYVQTGYFLTGESRPYKKGNFGRVKPKSVVGQGGYGAWEVVARYSTLDLTDGSVVGGEEENFTLGLNWYPTDTLRFMANYVNVLEVDGGTYDGVEPDIFQMRAQWAF